MHREWRHVSLDVTGGPYIFYYRDVLDAGLAVLRESEDDVLVGEELPRAADGGRQRSYSLKSGLFLAEQADVRWRRGDGARVMGVMLHSDEAVVSWNGSQPMYTMRANAFNARDGGGRWVTVGYIPHIPKVVGNGRNSRSLLVVSEARNDFVQLCFAIMLRQLVRASEGGAHVDMGQHGQVFLVPRVIELVVDQVEELCLLALMGNQCIFKCYHCLADCYISCQAEAAVTAAIPRPVISTLEAQLAAADARLADGRRRTRVAFGSTMNAFPFAPVLGAMHRLSTGTASQYKIVSFDTLHVWKLGVLRTLAQRVTDILEAV